MINHYPSSSHHYWFKYRLHCRILNRQWHTGTDGSRLSVPALHPAVISFKKNQKKVPQASSLPTAAITMLASYRHARWLPPPPLHQAVHTRNNSYITDKGGGIQHNTNQPIHKSNRFIHHTEGFNTSQINSSTN